MVLNLALCCDAREKKPQHRCTTTVHAAYNCSKKVLETLLLVGILVRTNLFIQSCFRTTYTNFNNCCLRYIATRRKNLYRCTSTFSALNHCTTAVKFSSNLSAIYTKWCAQTFPPIFRHFVIFDGNFAKIVAPPGDENDNHVMLLKEQSLLKKC